jgi:hypothetical protein
VGFRSRVLLARITGHARAAAAYCAHLHVVEREYT